MYEACPPAARAGSWEITYSAVHMTHWEKELGKSGRLLNSQSLAPSDTLPSSRPRLSVTFLNSANQLGTKNSIREPQGGAGAAFCFQTPQEAFFSGSVMTWRGVPCSLLFLCLGSPAVLASKPAGQGHASEQQFLKCGLQTSKAPKTVSNGTQEHNCLYTNAKFVFVFTPSVSIWWQWGEGGTKPS